MLTLIAAVAENYALGKDNKLVWHLPDDFKRFKRLTSGHHIIMGRKTFESLPGPLPNRTHIVISRQENYNPEGCTVVHSLEKALELASEDKQPYVIGGGEIFRLALPHAERIELTRVHHTFEADTFFPKFNLLEWAITDEMYHKPDDKHRYAFTYVTFERKNPATSIKMS